MRRRASRARSRSTPPSPIDSLSLPRQKELALGVPGAQHWVNDLPNDANKKYVADFKEAQDLPVVLRRAVLRRRGMLINSAVVAVKGDLSKKDEMRAEMRKANYASVRGLTSTATTTSRSRTSICRTW
jgi:branched-chain amino acid transport system substrate-binding protein